MADWKERICDIVNNVEANVLDVYFLLVSECLKGASDPELRFKHIIEAVQGKSFLDKGESLYISEDVIKNNTDKYIIELVNYIQMLSDRNYPVDEFYGILYRHVFNGDLYSNETAIQGYLLYLLAEKTPGIPYYQTKKLLKLQDEEYKAIVHRIRPEIQKAVAMLNRRFKTKTEEMSQLYYISQDMESEEDRIVYWSVMMNIMRTICRERVGIQDSKDE